MDPLTLLKEWGPWALTVIAAARLWLLVESEIKDNRETRKKRQAEEAETDRKALGHLEAIRATAERSAGTLDSIAERLKGGRE